jgi:multiple sugar transport system substrate-binding protein
MRELTAMLDDISDLMPMPTKARRTLSPEGGITDVPYRPQPDACIRPSPPQARCPPPHPRKPCSTFRRGRPRSLACRKWWKDLIAAYEKKYPDTKVNIQQVPFAQFVKQMTVRFAAGTPPDIVHLPSRDFASFADQGWLEPLDERLKSTDILRTWTPLESEMSWGGKTQGVLLMGYGGMLFYNEQKLKDAKLDVPKTPDQWLSAMKATTDASKGNFGLATITAEHPNMVVEMASWVIGSGADWLKGGKYNFTDPAVVKAVDGWRQSVTYAPKGTNSAQARQLFIDGKVTFLRDGPWVWGAVAKAPADVKPALKIGALPFAVTPGGASNSLHLAAKTEAKKKDAAWKFIELAASPEWQNRYALTGSPGAAQGRADRRRTCRRNRSSR